MSRVRDERLATIERAAASGIGASVDDTLWLVQRIHGLRDLIGAADNSLAVIARQVRDASKLATECRASLDHERRG